MLVVLGRCARVGLGGGSLILCLGYREGFSEMSSYQLAVLAQVGLDGLGCIQIPDAQPPGEPDTAMPSYWHVSGLRTPSR